MVKLKIFSRFILIAILFTNSELFGLTHQDILQEHAKWVDILGLQGLSTDPVKIYRYIGDGIYEQEVIDVEGKGLKLTYDAKTGELIGIYNYYQGHIEQDADAAGKKVIFSLDKETCREKLAMYYKLITGEKLPDIEISNFPVIGSLIRPTREVGYSWQRTYKGYPVRQNFVAISLFADTGTFAVYMKKYRSDLPPTVEVKITADQARQKAIEIADREIKDWVQFLDFISTETAISQLDDKIYRGIKSTLKGKSRQIKQESQQYASLIGCKPIEVKAPYLEIVNIREDAFNRQYMQPEAYEKSHKWNPATRLCWVITLYYQNPETKVGAQFEVDIDAYDGSVVNGSRPWD